MSRWRRTCPCPARSGHAYQRSRRCRRQTPRGCWHPKSSTTSRSSQTGEPPCTPRRTRTRPAPRRRRPAAPPCSSVQTRPPPLASSTSRPAALPTEAFQMHRRGHRSIFPGDSSTDDAGDGSACRSKPCSASFYSNDFLHHHPGPQDGDQQCRAPDSAREAHPLGQHPRARPYVRLCHIHRFDRTAAPSVGCALDSTMPMPASCQRDLALLRGTPQNCFPRFRRGARACSCVPPT